MWIYLCISEFSELFLLSTKLNLMAETCTAQCLHKDRAMCLQGSCLQQLRAAGQALVIRNCTPENTCIPLTDLVIIYPLFAVPVHTPITLHCRGIFILHHLDRHKTPSGPHNVKYVCLRAAGDGGRHCKATEQSLVQWDKWGWISPGSFSSNLLSNLLEDNSSLLTFPQLPEQAFRSCFQQGNNKPHSTAAAVS